MKQRSWCSDQLFMTCCTLRIKYMQAIAMNDFIIVWVRLNKGIAVCDAYYSDNVEYPTRINI